MQAPHANNIEVEGLVREFKNGAARGRRHRPPGRPRRDLRLPRPQRRRQVDDGADADDAAAADRRHAPASPASTSSPKARGCARAIGAALQEAALDPLLTGREHMRLQTALHGIAKAEREARGDELLERVGLSEAADRKVGGYSGGMKRRLDLALALAHRPAHPLPRRADHRPRHPEPHRALGGGRAAGRRGRGHRLPHHPVPGGGRRARRPGRDHRPRQDRRRGHAGGAEGRDRPADRRSGAARPGRARAHAPRSSRASASPPAASPKGAAVRLARRRVELAEVVRALDAEGIAIEHLQLHAPSLDDVFLAKTGRSLEGAEEAEEEAEDAAAEAVRPGVSGGLRTQVGQLARRSVLRTLRQPAQIVPALIFPLFLLAVNSRRAQRRHQPARLPDRLLPHLRPRRPLHAGGAVLGDERRHRPRPRHRDRLPQPPGADPAARRGAAQRPARRRRRARPAAGGRPT